MGAAACHRQENQMSSPSRSVRLIRERRASPSSLFPPTIAPGVNLYRYMKVEIVTCGPFLTSRSIASRNWKIVNMTTIKHNISLISTNLVWYIVKSRYYENNRLSAASAMFVWPKTHTFRACGRPKMQGWAFYAVSDADRLRKGHIGDSGTCLNIYWPRVPRSPSPKIRRCDLKIQFTFCVTIGSFK